MLLRLAEPPDHKETYGKRERLSGASFFHELGLVAIVGFAPLRVNTNSDANASA